MKTSSTMYDYTSIIFIQVPVLTGKILHRAELMLMALRNTIINTTRSNWNIWLYYTYTFTIIIKFLFLFHLLYKSKKTVGDILAPRS